jgi:hypothetical protein
MVAASAGAAPTAPSSAPAAPTSGVPSAVRVPLRPLFKTYSTEAGGVPVGRQLPMKEEAFQFEISGPDLASSGSEAKRETIGPRQIALG